MRTNGLSLALLAPVLGVLLAVATPAAAQGPTTLWNFLGIPQGIQKIRDVSTNRRGNRPQAERKDPLKRIADPENLESENPAIKKAAEVKKEEDLKKQKIKAIKYLATVGCGCYPGVADALLASLEDCTEEVRYEAAIAFCEAAGDKCDRCEEGCCNAEVMQKLHEMAYGQDEKGCDVESSQRVRAAARNALNACVEKHPPGPAPIETPPIEPGPIETPPTETPTETPLTPIPSELSPPPMPPGAPVPPGVPSPDGPFKEETTAIGLPARSASTGLINPSARYYPAADNLGRALSWPVCAQAPTANPPSRLADYRAVNSSVKRVSIYPVKLQSLRNSQPYGAGAVGASQAQ